MSDSKGRVTGLGGIFVKSGDTDSLIKWYREKLGFPFDGYGSSFLFREHHDMDREAYTVWGPFKSDTDYFKPSSKEFMINLRVENLVDYLEQLKAQGIEQVGEMEEYDYGRFAWIVDPDGTKIELWEQIGEPPNPDGETSPT